MTDWGSLKKPDLSDIGWLGAKPNEGWLIKPKASSEFDKAGQPIDAVLTGYDLGTGDKTVLTTFENGEVKYREITAEELYVQKEYNNKMPTHDPYTNPDSPIYYECSCGDILDPGTHSFAALNNAASNKGWKVRWNKDGSGYKPYCVKCGEGVE